MQDLCLDDLVEERKREGFVELKEEKNYLNLIVEQTLLWNKMHSPLMGMGGWVRGWVQSTMPS
jgi:hypothetical protein